MVKDVSAIAHLLTVKVSLVRFIITSLSTSLCSQAEIFSTGQYASWQPLEQLKPSQAALQPGHWHHSSTPNHREGRDAQHGTKIIALSETPRMCVATCRDVLTLSFSSAEISSNGQHALCQPLQQPQRSRASPQRCLHVRTEHRTAALRAVITCHTRIFSCVHVAHGHSDCFSKFYRHTARTLKHNTNTYKVCASFLYASHITQATYVILD